MAIIAFYVSLHTEYKKHKSFFLKKRKNAKLSYKKNNENNKIKEIELNCFR